jgi:DNA-binding CsgD family transcriptional regulator
VELDSDTRDNIARLTSRELQVFETIARGKTAKDVARQLRISEWTVGTHLRRILAKLGVDNQAAMVHRCALLIESVLRTEPGAPRAPASVD